MTILSTKFIANDAVTGAKFKLDNAQAFRARNAADSADVNLFNLDASDLLQFTKHPLVSTSATLADHVLTKKDQDAALEGLKPKEASRVATTANITLSGEQTIDGVLTSTDRVLVKDQTAASENGIYVSAAGAWARSSDMNSASEVDGATTFIQEGTTQAGYQYGQSGTFATLDTDDIVWVVRANQTSTGGDGIDVTGSTFSVDHDGNGLTFATGQLSLELDGTTLSKSGTGLKVGTITETELDSGIDAESFVLSAGYAAAAGTVAIADTIEVALEKLAGNADAFDATSFDLSAGYAPAAGTVAISDSIEVAIEKIVGNINALDSALFGNETFTLIAGDITNQYVDLAQSPTPGSITFQPRSGPPQIEGVDYTVSTNRITFAGDIATGGDAALVATDVIYIKYSY